MTKSNKISRQAASLLLSNGGINRKSCTIKKICKVRKKKNPDFFKSENVSYPMPFPENVVLP